MTIDRDQLRAFALRPWAENERQKREQMAESARRDPAQHAATMSALHEHMRTVRPEWPTPTDLESDFDDHVALKAKLDRAGAAMRLVRARVR